MKKYRRLALVFGMSCMLLMGCTSENNKEYKNLDLSQIKEVTIPEETVYQMDIDLGTWDDKKIYTDFPALICAYGNRSLDELDLDREIVCDVASKDGELKYKPIGRQKDHSAIRYLHYYADDCHIDIMQSGMFEMYHVDTAARITGESMDDYKFAWRPQFSGNVTASYQIGQDSLDGVTYRLDGKETALNDAVDYIEKEFLTEDRNLPNLYVPGMEYKVRNVDVYQFGENYGYYFTIELYYQGILVDTEEAHSEDSSYQYFGNTIGCMMLTSESVDYIWGCTFYREPDTKKEVSVEVGYEDAVKLASEHLSQDFVFEVKKADLRYVCYTDYDPEKGYGMTHIRPVWQFELSNEGIQQYNRILIEIDVVTGEVRDRYA